MRMQNNLFRITLMFFVLGPWSAGTVSAMSEGNTAQSEPYVSGGIALGEREALERRRADFSLWIATAAKKSGSYLADVRIKIADAAGKAVLDVRLDGPWLLVDLKPGRYTVDASFHDQSQRKTTSINRKGDHREMLFYYEVEAETLAPHAKD